MSNGTKLTSLNPKNFAPDSSCLLPVSYTSKTFFNRIPYKLCLYAPGSIYTKKNEKTKQKTRISVQNFVMFVYLPCEKKYPSLNGYLCGALYEISIGATKQIKPK